MNYFPCNEKLLHNSKQDQEHPPGGRNICVKDNSEEVTVSGKPVQLWEKHSIYR